MSINGVSSSNYIAPSMVISGTQNSQVNSGSDPDGDGDGGVKKSRGHGQMQAALMQALQSLGLSPTGTTTSTSGTNSTSQNSSSADSDGDTDGSTSATGSVKSDMRKLMHALFQALKNENPSNSTAGAAATPGPTDPKVNFASGLSALITQVSNGNAPTDLQNAFSQVAKDLQAAGSASNSTASSSSGSTPQATLQALLNQLQQNLGYGASSSTAGIGNFLSAQA